jgi:FAD/FMN-containing dehydrogenase
MGIVIWASIKCELIPSVHKYVFIPGESIQDLIDICYKVERIRLGDEVMLGNGAQFAAILAAQRSDVAVLKKALPAWTVVIGLAGSALFPEERVRVQELDLDRLVQQCGLTLVQALPKIPQGDIARAFEGCSRDPYFKFQEKGACQDVFFLTTLDKAPQFVSNVFSIAERMQYPTSDIGVYIQPQHHGVSQHVEFNFPFDPGDENEAARVKQVYEKVSEALLGQGAYFSRPYGSWASMVYSRDVNATRVLRTVKHIVDPRNVLNPGKLCF